MVPLVYVDYLNSLVQSGFILLLLLLLLKTLIEVDRPQPTQI